MKFIINQRIQNRICYFFCGLLIIAGLYFANTAVVFVSDASSSVSSQSLRTEALTKCEMIAAEESSAVASFQSVVTGILRCQVSLRGHVRFLLSDLLPVITPEIRSNIQKRAVLFVQNGTFFGLLIISFIHQQDGPKGLFSQQ